jgi:hypothetical protein
MKSKSELYKDDRNIIVKKIFNILNINDSKNTFYLHELDNNIQIQESILLLEEDIKKCYVCGSWACFYNKNVKRKVLSIIKNVLKCMNYNLIPKRVLIKINNESKSDTIYYVIKNI